MNRRTIDYLFKSDIPKMEKLLSIDFPEDGHEPDEHGVTAELKNGNFDNSGSRAEMRVELSSTKKHLTGDSVLVGTLNLRITDLIAMAQYGYKKWKESP